MQTNNTFSKIVSKRSQDNIPAKSGKKKTKNWQRTDKRNAWQENN